MKKKARGKEGNAVSYTTRNQALTRLQIKLPEFRRLCILKGIHPREPKKKVHGHNKTYYHIKDINFLAHEPLLEKGRDLKAFQRKVKKAKGRQDHALLQRLLERKPEYTLDHLVKERYPSFIDALRDLDDSLTLVHLFATLPADSSHKIPVERIHAARRLSLEWQAYVTRTNSLRKVFVSVKGTYFQAEVYGQTITWLVPHALSQEIPNDVDFRVMLTFLEFYETLISFTNFKLYHDIGLAYPPILDPKLEETAAELYAIMKDLSQKMRSSKKDGQIEEESHEEKDEQTADSAEKQKKDIAETRQEHAEALHADAAVQLASLQSRLAAMQKQSEDKVEEEAEKASASAMILTDEDVGEDDETKKCRNLFKGLVFFLAREVPRESLLFVIQSFGGTATWEGEGAPLPENDDSITHQVVDRPSQKHRHLSREYIQPQWIFDCANNRILLPCAEYGPGNVPPPHLSPFVNHDEEGYVPEYAKALEELRNSEAGQVAALPGTEGLEVEEVDPKVEAALRQEDIAAAAKLAQVEAQELEYRSGIEKELKGIAFSESLALEEENKEKKHAKKLEDIVPMEDDEAAMAQIMMPRKTQKLYEAMKMGKAKKRANVQLLEERKKKAKQETSKKSKK